jgi:hypothetical protein
MPKCIEPTCTRLCAGTRCDDHRKAKDRSRNVRRTHYRGGWESFARKWLDAWTAAHGPLCVGWQCEPHMVTRADLTLDHVEARTGAAGYQSLCRSCNSSKGARNAVEGTELRR